MKKNRVVLLSTAVVLTLMLAWNVWQRPEELPTVAVVRAQCEDVYNSITISGQLESTKMQRISLARLAVAQEIYVKQGALVAKGTPLFSVRYSQASLPTVEVAETALQQVFSGEMPNDYITGVEDTTCIYASQAGIVLELPTGGAQLVPGVVCASVADCDALQLRARVPELYVAGLSAGQRANFTLTATPENIFRAKVSVIAPYAVTAMNVLGQDGDTAVETLLNVESKSSLLRPGYTASIKIFTDHHADAITVPYEAVVQEGEQEVVYAVRNGILVRTPIVSGYSLSRGIEICEGLEDGELLALPGETVLADGLQVQMEALA